MRNTLKSIATALILIVASAIPASAQFSFGPKIGVDINRLSFNKDIMSSDNRAGFTGGIMVEAMIPVTNLGIDASLMYVHRTAEVLDNANTDNNGTSYTSIGKDYIEIPINLKWKIGLPLLGKLLTPYVFTGPSFAFLTSKKAISEADHNKSFDVAWNIGAGVQLFSKLQVGASYGFGMTNAIKAVTGSTQSANIDGKNRYWTVTAAWLF
jgi:hypothetical protein